jgi:hypothetical protein
MHGESHMSSLPPKQQKLVAKVDRAADAIANKKKL